MSLWIMIGARVLYRCNNDFNRVVKEIEFGHIWPTDRVPFGHVIHAAERSRSMQIRTNLHAALIAALAYASGGAYASSFQLSEQNASGLGNAFAGQAAAAENPSTVFFNPAGMAYLPGIQVSGTFHA